MTGVPATPVGGVSISITADNDNFIAELKRVEAETKRTGKRITDEFNGATLKTKAWNNALSQTQGQLVGLVAVGAIAAIGKEILDAADKFSTMRSKLSLVVSAGEDLYQIEEDLFQQAQRNRADLQATVTLYTKLRNARKDLTDVAAQEIVDTWSKTLLVSGASASEAASATLQFAQAMASGRLQGDELRSILENNTRFATLLADGLGITVGMLRKMGAEGELTVDKITAAMQAGGAKLTSEAESISVTMGQAWQNLGNATIRLVGLLDSVVGVSKFLASAIQGVASAVEALSNLLPKGNKLLDESAAVSKKVAKAMGDVSAAIADNPLEKLRVAAEKAKDPLSAVEDKLKKIGEEAEKSGAKQKQAAIDMVGVAILEAEIMKGRLADQLKLQRSQQELTSMRLDARFGTGQQYLSNQERTTNKTLADAIEAKAKEISDLQATLKSVLTTDKAKFLPPKEKDDDEDGKKEKERVETLQEYRTEYQALLEDISKLQNAGPELVGDRSSAALKSILDYAKATDDWATALYMVKQLQSDITDSVGVSISKQLLNPKDIEEFDQKLQEWMDKQPDYESVFGRTPTPELELPEFEAEEGYWDRYHEQLANVTARGFAEGVMTGDWGDQVENLLRTGLDNAFNDAVNNLGKLLTKLFEDIDWGALLKTGGDWLGSIGSAIFGGARAGEGPVKKGWAYNVNETAGEQFIAPANGYIMHRAKNAPAAKGDTFRMGGLTFVNNGTASAEIYANVEQMFEMHRRMSIGALQKWKNDRMMRGDL